MTKKTILFFSLFALICLTASANDNGRMLWGSINSTSNASAGSYKSYNNIILLSWRMLPGDNTLTAFDLYRSTDGGAEVKLNSTPITGRTNWQDKTADRTKTNTYRLTLSGQSETIGQYTMPAAQASSGLPYVQIDLKDTKDVCALDTIWYEANDASVGDLDGDGKIDYREDGKHYIGQGPEFFSVVDGLTGRELARADYITRGKSEDWGDGDDKPQSRPCCRIRWWQAHMAPPAPLHAAERRCPMAAYQRKRIDLLIPKTLY